MTPTSVRTIQAVAARGGFRGLPRLTWAARHQLIGRHAAVISYRDRFALECPPDCYPTVMAACGFVYREIERLFATLIQPPATIIDVGANIGFVTMLACSLDPNQIQLHAFEPDPNVFPRLQQNIALNPTFRVIANQTAVGATSGTARLTISARPGWSTLADEPQGGFSFLPKSGATDVPVVTLDEYCASRGLSPQLIKIDVEGYETRVVAGAAETLRRCRPFVIAEVNPLRLEAAGSSPEALTNAFTDLGFCLYHVRSRLASLANSDRRAASRWNGLTPFVAEDAVHGCDFDVIAVPAEIA